MSVPSPESAHAREIEAGKRFPFGRNWQNFLGVVNESRVAEAERSLTEMLKMPSLEGKTFLDVGCGSGLFSLAARRLGANVYSFDFDPHSVACARELRERFCPGLDQWVIEEGSVLDDGYINRIGQFDIVYSWGVLHHTGQMWPAVERVTRTVSPGGLLFIAIYNDQGWRSNVWRFLKRLYCSSAIGRWLVQGMVIPWFFVRAIGVGLIKTGTPWGEFASYRKKRGMSIYHDWIDWLGGYPFEVATTDAMIRWHEERGFRLINLKPTRRLGCNEFVFERTGQ